MAVLTNYEGSNDDYENIGTGDVYRRAQSFQLALASTVSSVSFWGSKGNGATGTFEIRITTGAAPDASVIYTETFNTSVLSAYGSPAWNELTLTTPQNLSASTTYYLEIHPLTGSATDEIRWAKDTTSPSYASGACWQKNTGSWVENTSLDENFRISGSSSTDVTVSATVVSVTASIPASTQSGGATIAPNVLTATFSVQSATELIDEFFTPAQPITATFSIPAVNIITPDAQILATVLTATFSIPTATPSGGASIDATVQSATFSIPTVSFIGSVSITPDAQVATFTTLAPTISAIGNVTISATAVAATFSLQSPTVTAEQNAMFSAGVLSATFSIETPTITATRNVTIDASVVSAVFSIPTPLRKVGGLWTAQPRAQGVWTPQPRAI